jgi:hypothetical protein
MAKKKINAEGETMSETKWIHPFDLAELLDKLPIHVDVYKSKGPNGEDIIEIPNSNLRLIQDPTVPRKTFGIE